MAGPGLRRRWTGRLARRGALDEPGLAGRFEIILAHLARSLKFYGDALGLRVFRKHLGWYVENAPLALFGGDSAQRRRKRRVCVKSTVPPPWKRLLAALWRTSPLPIAAAVPI